MGSFRLAACGPVCGSWPWLEAAAAAELKAVASGDNWPSAGSGSSGAGNSMPASAAVSASATVSGPASPCVARRHGRGRLGLGLGLLMVPGEVGVDRRRHEQREHRADGHAGGDHHADSKRLAAPAPLAISSGTMATTMAAVVIRIGRSRMAAACSIASRRRIALLLLQLVGEVDHQDAVLGDQPDQRDEPDLRIDVDGGEPDVERDQRAEHRGRQRDQDDQRIAEALILRGEHQEDDDQREDEGDDERAALLHVLPAFALEVVGEAFGKLSACCLQEVDGLADRAARKRHARKASPN